MIHARRYCPDSPLWAQWWGWWHKSQDKSWWHVQGWKQEGLINHLDINLVLRWKLTMWSRSTLTRSGGSEWRSQGPAWQTSRRRMGQWYDDNDNWLENWNNKHIDWLNFNKDLSWAFNPFIMYFKAVFLRLNCPSSSKS